MTLKRCGRSLLVPELLRSSAIPQSPKPPRRWTLPLNPNPTQVTDELVDVLLTPLLSPGAADVVFDTLSYSAGPLPEQLLQDDRLSDTPVWVCYGLKDPWTSAQRVEALLSFPPVERVVPLDGVGHCPHDEAPERVNPLIIDFMRRVAEKKGELAGTAASGADQQAS